MKILLIVLASIGSLFVADNASAMIRPIKPDLTAHTFKLDCTPIVVPLLGAAYERYAPEYGV